MHVCVFMYMRVYMYVNYLNATAQHGLLHYRGKRAGWRVRKRKRDSFSCHHKPLATSGEQHPITIVDSSGFHRCRHSVTRSRDRTLVNMQRQPTTSRVTKLGILNARSIGNKHAQIVDEIMCGACSSRCIKRNYYL